MTKYRSSYLWRKNEKVFSPELRSQFRPRFFGHLSSMTVKFPIIRTSRDSETRNSFVSKLYSEWRQTHVSKKEAASLLTTKWQQLFCDANCHSDSLSRIDPIINTYNMTWEVRNNVKWMKTSLFLLCAERIRPSYFYHHLFVRNTDRS